MSYDIRFFNIRRPVEHPETLKDEDFGPFGPVEVVRARLEAIFPGGGVRWIDETWGKTCEIPWAEWDLLVSDDKASVRMVTLRTSGRVSSEERYALAERVADGTGWTALDLQGGAKRKVIAPRVKAGGRSCTP